MGRQTSRKGTVRFEGAGGNGMTFGPGPGDLTVGETNKENTTKVRAMDRGVFECNIETDDLEQACTLTIFMERSALRSLIIARSIDFMDQQGVFDPSTGSLPTQTTDPNPDIFSWRTIWTGLNGAGVTLPVCNGSRGWSEAPEGNSISITFNNNGKPIET